ncbi:uncharacterized protein LOC128239200 [Mya arenaria]|uniref:uncharacterized protein LOC128239200 n=1 Tax=Mya arenaria TaxID=6604 RepID=UPI0022E4B836|nr:uncharacterized protein LOC128239200 [Mya arenaria]
MSTIMFTSRHYCFQSENTVSVDANIRLKGIGRDSIQELARKALTFLMNTFTPTFSKFQLNQWQWSSPRLRNILRIPEFLLQLICQYIDGQSSAQESVLSMANLAFSWIDQLTLSQPLQSDCSGKTFPSKFDDTFLGKHKGLVLELGKFATEFICSPTSDFVSHSFRNKITTKLALEAGILFEEEDTSHASTNGVKVKFVDNAFRDLFSAIYISATKADSSRIFEHIKTAGKYSFDAINASWVYNFLQFVDKEYSKRFLEKVSKLSCETLWEKFYAYFIDPIRRLFAYIIQREENGIEIGSEALVEVVSK